MSFPYLAWLPENCEPLIIESYEWTAPPIFAELFMNVQLSIPVLRVATAPP